MSRAKRWSKNYRRRCFDAWYLQGRSNVPAHILEIIPPDDDGTKPTVLTVRKWYLNGGWDLLADDLDVKVEEKANISLINQKAAMLKRHQQDAVKLADKARDYLLLEGFDSASAAAQTYFRATEEQRKTAGFSDLLERLDKMTNNDVEREIVALLSRSEANEQIIETEAEDVDTVSPENIEE